MNHPIKLRLAAPGFGSALVGALIVVVTLTSRQRAEEPRNHLGKADLESMRISDRFSKR